MVLIDREKAVYFAKLAAMTERYDDMADLMLEAAVISPELSNEEMNLLSVAYKHSVGRRRAAWQCAVERTAVSSVNDVFEAEQLRREYRTKVEDELETICRTAHNLAKSTCLDKADAVEAKVFYHKMKADTCREAAQCKEGQEAKQCAAESARQAYEEASHTAKSLLPETHPLQFGLALNRSVFHSQVLNNPEEACRFAPTALRHLAPFTAVGGGLSPRGPMPVAVVAQRLCDLLLEFPMAVTGGVRWSTLERVYAEIYGESIDIYRLGYTSLSQAARALLVEVLKCSAGDASHTLAEGDIEDPLLEVEASVALTPLPGFAGSWPSLYSTLVAIVRSCGSEEEASDDQSVEGADSTTLILLLSQLRPLLQGGEVASAEVAGPVKSLLAQLRPVSQLRGAGAGDDGLCFRDAEGAFRRLQKMGHWVKAVLLWRDQRVQWQQASSAAPSAIDEAVLPHLELVFSKRYNNLVLRLSDREAQATPNAPLQEIGRVEPQTDKSQAPATPGVSNRETSWPEPPPDKSQARTHFDNPFKWMPPTLLTRSSEAPGKHAAIDEMGGETASGGKPRPVSAEEAAPANRTQSPLAAGRSPAIPSLLRVDARSENKAAVTRGRSLTWNRERPSTREGRAYRMDSMEARRHSEPPQPRVADVFDDPFEPPPQERQWTSQASQTRLDMAGPPPPTMHGMARSPQLTQFIELQIQVPRRGRATRSRSPAPRSRSVLGQAIESSSVASAAEARCQSEPPHPLVAEVFDDPFEPPPQQERQWISQAEQLPFFQIPIRGRPVRSQSPAQAPRSRSVLGRALEGAGFDLVAEARCQSEPPHPVVAEVFDDPFEPPPQERQWDPQFQQTRCEAIMSPPATAPAMAHTSYLAHSLDLQGKIEQLHLSQIRTRGRALESGSPAPRSRSVFGQAVAGGHGATAAEVRCQSEPPQPCIAEVFDDPFEPPPQDLTSQAWAAPSVLSLKRHWISQGASFPGIPLDSNKFGSTPVASVAATSPASPRSQGALPWALGPAGVYAPTSSQYFDLLRQSASLAMLFAGEQGSPWRLFGKQQPPWPEESTKVAEHSPRCLGRGPRV